MINIRELHGICVPRKTNYTVHWTVYTTIQCVIFQEKNFMSFMNQFPFMKILPFKCLLEQLSLSALDNWWHFPLEKLNSWKTPLSKIICYTICDHTWFVTQLSTLSISVVPVLSTGTKIILYSTSTLFQSQLFIK